MPPQTTKKKENEYYIKKKTQKMPGWLSNTLNAVVDEYGDDIVKQVQNQVSTHAASHLDAMGPAVTDLKDAALRSNTLAKETTELCRSTETKSQQMMGFCDDLKETLTGFKGSVDADAFGTIQELLSGDKVTAAMSLARDMNDHASQCVDKSVEMVTIMETTMDKLPGPLQQAIDQAVKSKVGEDQQSGEDPAAAQLTTLDRDIEDVQECMTAIKELNLFTALEVGLKAFEQFSLKAKVSRDMFDSIRGFSENVSEITDAFQECDVMTIVNRVKDLWKCLKLSSLMKKLAEGLGKLIQLVITLFEQTSSKVAGLWKALAFAKDCMKDCVDHAQEAKGMCLEATEKSTTLMDRSIQIKDGLEDMGELNAGSISAFQELSDGEEINTAISIANEMDELVLKCSSQALAMVDRVKTGWANLPPMVTEGITEDAGKQSDDPPPADVESNIEDLQASREAIEGADLFKAVSAGQRGFSDVSDKVSTAKQLLALLQNFAESCIQTINSFMGAWDLQTAIEKIKEMCRMVNLGEMMKQFADQIKRLLIAVIDLMKASVTKFRSLDVKDFSVKNVASQAASMVQNLDMDQATSMVQNLDMDDLKKVDIGKIGGQLGSFFK